MDALIKKKTKHFINLKTNNYIEHETHKEQFFNHLLTELEKEFQKEPQNYQFLMNYLLTQGNVNNTTVNGKRLKTQTKLNTHKRVPSQNFQQKLFNLNDIDPTLFQTVRVDNYLVKKQQLKNKIKSSQGYRSNFQKHTSTPRQQTLNIKFQNKKLLDLDRKIEKTYESLKKKIYQPKSLLCSNRKQITIKSGLKVQKRSFPKKIYRYTTQFESKQCEKDEENKNSNRNNKQNQKQKTFEIPDMFIMTSLRDKFPYKKQKNSISKKSFCVSRRIKTSNNELNQTFDLKELDQNYLNRKKLAFFFNNSKKDRDDFSDRQFIGRLSTMAMR